MQTAHAVDARMTVQKTKTRMGLCWSALKADSAEQSVWTRSAKSTGTEALRKSQKPFSCVLSKFEIASKAVALRPSKELNKCKPNASSAA